MPSASEAEVLVVAADALRVEVDVEELPVPQRLGHRLVEGEPGHRLVGELGVEPDHVRPLERADEGQRMAHRRQEDVAPGLVGLGLDGEPQRVPPLTDVGAAQVDRLFVTVEGGAHVLGRVGLTPLAAAPEHVRRGAELDAEVDGLERLLDGQAADLGVVGGEGARL